jgi:hypothetical protein
MHVYTYQATQSGFAESEILHVAGAPGDAQGAREYGLYTALSWNAPLPGSKPCFLLNNMTDLLPVFGIDVHSGQQIIY